MIAVPRTVQKKVNFGDVRYLIAAARRNRVMVMCYASVLKDIDPEAIQISIV
jgi:hypothetical protein